MNDGTLREKIEGALKVADDNWGGVVFYAAVEAATAVAYAAQDNFMGFVLKENADGTYTVPMGAGVMIELRPALPGTDVPPYQSDPKTGGPARC